MEPSESLLNDFEQPQYKYVGFWPRFGAVIIDGIILSVAAYIFSLALSFLNESINSIVTTILYVSYYFFLEYKYGATPGKMVFGIKIVTHELQPLTVNNVLLRNIFNFSSDLANLIIQLYTSYAVTESDIGIGGFGSIADIFTPQLTIYTVYLVASFILNIVDLIFLLTDEKYRSLHDRIGKTYVVKKTNDLITIPANP